MKQLVKNLLMRREKNNFNCILVYLLSDMSKYLNGQNIVVDRFAL